MPDLIRHPVALSVVEQQWVPDVPAAQLRNDERFRACVVLAACVAALACALAASPASAQAYPAKPIRYIIAFPPGGSNDIFARIVGARMAELMSTTVLVDNRPGGGA